MPHRSKITSNPVNFKDIVDSVKGKSIKRYKSENKNRQSKSRQISSEFEVYYVKNTNWDLSLNDSLIVGGSRSDSIYKLSNVRKGDVFSVNAYTADSITETTFNYDDPNNIYIVVYNTQSAAYIGARNTLEIISYSPRINTATLISLVAINVNVYERNIDTGRDEIIISEFYSSGVCLDLDKCIYLGAAPKVASTIPTNNSYWTTLNPDADLYYPQNSFVFIQIKDGVYALQFNDINLTDSSYIQSNGTKWMQFKPKNI